MIARLAILQGQISGRAGMQFPHHTRFHFNLDQGRRTSRVEMVVMAAATDACAVAPLFVGRAGVSS